MDTYVGLAPGVERTLASVYDDGRPDESSQRRIPPNHRSQRVVLARPTLSEATKELGPAWILLVQNVSLFPLVALRLDAYV